MGDEKSSPLVNEAADDCDDAYIGRRGARTSRDIDDDDDDDPGGVDMDEEKDEDRDIAEDDDDNDDVEELTDTGYDCSLNDLSYCSVNTNLTAVTKV